MITNTVELVHSAVNHSFDEDLVGGGRGVLLLKLERVHWRSPLYPPWMCLFLDECADVKMHLIRL